ncbi:1-acyl-sn-glycerol-3-phosphate acyltransferase [Thalassolituus sp. LLYu03]|uniref:1-acyl-sn-glycerol-3-phosphate acyltransferase n=1 Tax=Thalassolituus sp. LLYu03 TaxID=3421656 RepID=UPI003D2B3BDA
MQDAFADIRPYNDDEVPAVIERLMRSGDLAGALLKYRFPRIPAWLRPLLSPLLWAFMKQRLKSIHTVETFQHLIADWVEAILEKSSAGIEVRGLDKLEPGKSYLWISNHRDIAMDPTMINFSLHHAGWPTSRIAIGDNLLRHPDVSDIMRLNKSFVVKRTVANKREKLRELQRLSAYIRESLDDGHSIWIAQREGRAKDGIDETDTAVIKMLALNGRDRDEAFTDTMRAMRPVPVSIQYEWDPCDLLKARELTHREQHGRYEKADDEDTRSILLGLTGFKGRIFVDFGEPLSDAELESPDAVAAAIDRQLTEMTEILPVHEAALSLLNQSVPDTLQPAAKLLQSRMAGAEPGVQDRLLRTYAAPLLQRKK